MHTYKTDGEVAEWSKANDSKSFNRKLFVGSNPTLSVKYFLAENFNLGICHRLEDFPEIWS